LLILFVVTRPAFGSEIALPLESTIQTYQMPGRAPLAFRTKV